MIIYIQEKQHFRLLKNSSFLMPSFNAFLLCPPTHSLPTSKHYLPTYWSKINNNWFSGPVKLQGSAASPCLQLEDNISELQQRHGNYMWFIFRETESQRTIELHLCTFHTSTPPHSSSIWRIILGKKFEVPLLILPMLQLHANTQNLPFLC